MAAASVQKVLMVIARLRRHTRTWLAPAAKMGRGRRGGRILNVSHNRRFATPRVGITSAFGINAKCSDVRGYCERHFVPTIRGQCYCARNLYATIRATMLAKISSAGRDFRIIGLAEWPAADRPA